MMASTNSVGVSLLIANESPKICPAATHFSLRFKNSHFLSSPLLSQPTHFTYPSLFHKRCNLCSFHAQKKKPRNGSTALMVSSDLEDEDDDELEAFDDDFVDDDNDEDGVLFLPFDKMQKWMENKPRGFGEGKVYDTSIEDKLLEEIEQSSKALTANLDNLKIKPTNSPSKKDHKNKKVPEAVTSSIRVRVFNLPKKKNIHRDLQSAFKEVAGVVNIIPAVSGNKKTKDPICKGFAFVDFKSEEDAHRFFQEFSGQSVAFGRMEKRIKCTMANSPSNSSDNESAGSFSPDSDLTVPAPEEDMNANFTIDDSSLEETSSDAADFTDEFRTEKLQDVTNNLESFSISELDDDSMEPMTKPATSSFSQKKPDKHRAIKKKITAQGGGKKVPKLEIPAFSERLKIKEKAVLTNVFSKYSKYGAQSAPTLKRVNPVAQSALTSVEES